jgi:hypothetical protein
MASTIMRPFELRKHNRPRPAAVELAGEILYEGLCRRVYRGAGRASIDGAREAVSRMNRFVRP